MSEGKLHHLFDLRELLPAAADVVVADVVEALLLVLSGRKEMTQSAVPPASSWGPFTSPFTRVNFTKAFFSVSVLIRQRNINGYLVFIG